MQPQRFDYAILALGVCAVSTAAIFIREAEAPALIIAAYRLTLASLPLLLISAVHARRPHPSDRRRAGSYPLPKGEGTTISQTRRLLLVVFAGAFLALHFAFWIASVQQTSIVTSVVLVTAQPLFVALASGPLLGERPSSLTWLGIAIAAAGAAVMVAGDIGEGRDTLLGDLYAILGAVFAAGYFFAGRSLRVHGEGWLPYVTKAYSVSAVILVGLAAASGEAFTGYSVQTYAYFVLLAFVPQLIGHTALNRSLGYLPVVAVTIAVLGEPVGATILGAVFLSEEPTAVEIGGGLLVLAGVYFGLRGSIAHVTPAMTEPGP